MGVKGLWWIASLSLSWAVLLVVSWLLPVKKRWWAWPLLLAGGYFLGNMVIMIADPVNLPVTLGFFLAAVLLSCQGTVLQRVTIAVILACMGLSLSTLAQELIQTSWNYPATVVIRLLFWSVLYLALRKWAPRRAYQLPGRYWGLLDLLALSPFSTVLIVVLISQNYRINLQQTLLLLVAFLTSFGLLLAVIQLSRQYAMEQENALLHINESYFASLAEQQFQVRRLRHDLAGHLQAMSGLAEPELRAYLAELLDTPALGQQTRFCENQVANSVLCAKQAAMEQAGIQATLDVVLPEGVPIRAVDLCAVLANSLDNAIEACQKLPRDQRRLSVKARADKGMFVLRVENTMAEPPRKQGGRLMTSKADKASHGLGLRSMEEIAHRCGGSLELTPSQNQFTLTLYLPAQRGCVGDAPHSAGPSGGPN